jgi:hypothetical protein
MINVQEYTTPYDDDLRLILFPERSMDKLQNMIEGGVYLNEILSNSKNEAL